MEGSRETTTIQHDVDSFLQVTKIREKSNDCLIPIQELPIHYRKEIDRGYSTGWRCVDEYLQGIRHGEMTVITADTGAGKTTFCTQLMVNCAMQGIPVWVNSWEMRPEMTMRKIASIVLRKPMKLINFTDEDNNVFDDWGRSCKVFVNPNTIGTDISMLSIELLKAKSKGVKVVMLDHLDYLVNTKRDKTVEAIDETVKRLHELAFALEMHFFLICHPRQSMNATEEIGLHSLKGSSAIKQYADNVILLHRCARTDDQAYPGKVKIKIAKNRMFGIEGSTYLFYQSEWDGYVELERANA